MSQGSNDETQEFHGPRPSDRSSASAATPRQEKKVAGYRLPLLLVAILLPLFLMAAGAIAVVVWWRSPAKNSTTTIAKSPVGAADTASAVGDNKQPPRSRPLDLAGAIAEADRLDRKWRWEELWAGRASVADDENGALVVLEAGRMLPRDGAPPDFVDRAGETGLDEAQLAELLTWLKPREGALEVALTLADKPRGRYPLEVAPDMISTLLPGATTVQQVARVLQVAAVRRAESGDAGNLEEFRAMHNAARSIGDEPFLTSQVVRASVAKLAVLSLEQSMARTSPHEEVLASAQRLLSEELAYNGALVGFRGERAIVFRVLEGIDAKTIPLTSIEELLRYSNPPKEWPVNATPGSQPLGMARAWSLDHLTRIVEVAKQPVSEQIAAMPALSRDEAGQSVAAVPFLFTATGMGSSDYLRLFQRRRALLCGAVVALAAERSRLRSGRWPLEASELDAAAFERLPVDPYDGNPVRFRRSGDSLIVYCIGLDMKDDGGDLGDRGDAAADVGFRLREPNKRR